MKRLYTLLAATCATIWATAATVTFDLTTGYSDQQAEVTTANSGVTISFKKGTGNVPPVWLASLSNMRVYPGNTLTISCDNTITQVEFTFGDKDHSFKAGTASLPTLTSGDYAESGTTGTWQGSATAITFTAQGSKGHARLNAITVTVEGEIADAVPNPVISPAGAMFSDEQAVTITCDDHEAAIHYTTDGTEPHALSALYSGPLTLTATTTLKAIAIKGDAQSSVVTAQFTQIAGVASIAEFLAAGEGETMVFNNPVVVTHQTEKHLYVQDDTGAMYIWGETGQTYAQGDVIPAGFWGTSATYGGEPELSVYHTNNFLPATERVEVKPAVITPQDINTLNFARLVTIKNVTFDEMGDGYCWIIDARNSENYCMGYTLSFNVPLPQDLDAAYDVTGIVGSHYNIGTIYYLQPLTFGPATSALYYTVVKCFRQKEKNTFAIFWRAFRGNLKQGIKATLITVPVMLLLIFGYGVMKENWGSEFGAVMFVAYDIALVVPLGILCWLFPLLGRFDAPLGHSLKTAAMLTFRHLPSTVIVVLLTVETFVSLIEKWWPVFFAPTLWVLLESLFMERIFPKYLTEPEIEKMNLTSETPVEE